MCYCVFQLFPVYDGYGTQARRQCQSFEKSFFLYVLFLNKTFL